ncbi:MAG TPA: hypothetical protein VK988_16680 [Acidimicrobiales bacterium]|nr:hypothetical protein [Acidimicrobiales bacterium]
MPPKRVPRLITVTFEDPDTLFVDDLSSVLFDTVLLHDAVVLAGPEYNYNFSQYFYRRNGRPVSASDRLRLERLRHESPLLLETVALHVAAFWTVARTYEWLRDWSVRRRRVRAEATKAELEVEKTRAELLEIRQRREREELELKLLQDEALDRQARRERDELEPAGQRSGLKLHPVADAPPLILPPQVQAVLAEQPDARRIVERQAARLASSPLDVSGFESRRIDR